MQFPHRSRSFGMYKKLMYYHYLLENRDIKIMIIDKLTLNKSMYIILYFSQQAMHTYVFKYTLKTVDISHLFLKKYIYKNT